MTCNLKALGLTFLALLMGSGLAAAAASGSDVLKSETSEPIVLTGHGENNIFKFTTESSLEVHCWNAIYAGTVAKPGIEDMALYATYKGKKGEPENTICEDIFGIVRVDTNGCRYIFTGSTTREDGGKADAEVKIACPEGKEIEFTNNCKIKIPAQTVTTGGVTYANGTENGKGDVTVTATMTNLTYSTQGAFCTMIGLPAEASNADLTGTITITGYNDLCEPGKCPENGDEFKEGTQVGIEVS